MAAVSFLGLFKGLHRALVGLFDVPLGFEYAKVRFLFVRIIFYGGSGHEVILEVFCDWIKKVTAVECNTLSVVGRQNPLLFFLLIADQFFN